jgi:transcriptional regulator with XRE-family HTH domain
MNIGEKIRKLRNGKLMTQAELAGTQITRNMLSQIESGTAMPSLQTILYLAGRLNVPAGFLLAEGDDEFIYRKMNYMPDIKRAYESGEYRICLDLCRTAIANKSDDEIGLILAECSLGLAREQFAEGHLHTVCRLLDDALDFSQHTIYRTSHIRAEAAVLFRYLRRLSRTLFSELLSEDEEDRVEFWETFSRSLCRYVMALEALDEGERGAVDRYLQEGETRFAEDDGEMSATLLLHLQAKCEMADGDYASAHACLTRLLRDEERVSKPILYSVFCDLEVCCREMNDYKGAYEYASIRSGMLETMLEDTEP